MQAHFKYFITSIFIAICLHWSCTASKTAINPPKTVYKTNNLVILQLTEHTFQHISYLQTNDFGKVACNGLLVIDQNEAIVFDTPTNDNSAMELIKWANETIHCPIKAVIPTHFHDDCLGGLEAFHAQKIPSYANAKTIALVKEKGGVVPQNAFQDSLLLKVGKQVVTAKFFGEGHTKDNVVGYFAAENVLFGGCLIKTLNASKGYLGDANVAEWSKTVEKVKKEYPAVQIVIPGHGDCGDKQLLDYTIQLFKTL